MFDWASILNSPIWTLDKKWRPTTRDLPYKDSLEASQCQQDASIHPVLSSAQCPRPPWCTQPQCTVSTLNDITWPEELLYPSAVQEVSTSTVAGARASDLAILGTAASQLFESTAAMGTPAVVSVLEALREVSSRSIPKALQTPGPPK